MRFPLRAALRLSLPALLVGSFLLGCNRGDRDPILPPGPEAQGREYYPMQIGSWWEYDVTDHLWNLNRDSVVRFQFRERVDTVFRGATGELNYRIVRARRNDTSAVWRDDSVLAVVLKPAEVRVTYANVPKLELLFAMWEGRSWNPNLYNADSSSRSYQNLGQSFQVPGGRTFARTVRVVDEPDVSNVNRREYEQVFAWQVGRVYRKRVMLDYCNTTEVNQGLCQLGSGYIVRGKEREERLKAWGQ